MPMRPITIVAAAIFAAVGMAMPISARTTSHHLSAAQPSIGPTEALQQQGGRPPTGYCLKCLPPDYAWPRGGAGPG